MNPIETATLDELMDEIKRRSANGLVIVSGHNPKNDRDFLAQYWGSQLWAAGACRYIEMDALEHLKNEPEIEE